MREQIRYGRAAHATGISLVEAAFVTELSRKTIDQSIDRKEVRSLPSPRADEPLRLLGYPELVYLRVRRDVAGTLTASARQALYAELRRRLPQDPRLDHVAIGPVRVSVAEAVASVRERLAKVWRARRSVSIHPDVRAGEPVVRGTRVPVYVLADLTRQGASRQELLEDYPAVASEALEAALLFAQLHPRRGPRRPAPWHDGPPVSSTKP